MAFWNKHKQQQGVCLLAETNTASDERLDAGTNHAENPDTAEAWGLDSKQQCKDEKTGRYIQFVCSLSCDPVPIYRSAKIPVLKTDTALMASQTEDQELTFITPAGGKNSQLLWLGICLALLSLTVCIIAFTVIRRG